MNTTNVSTTEAQPEMDFLACLDKPSLGDAWIYWKGFERVASEGNDLDGAELGRKWIGLVEAEIQRRKSGGAG